VDIDPLITIAFHPLEGTPQLASILILKFVYQR